MYESFNLIFVFVSTTRNTVYGKNIPGNLCSVCSISEEKTLYTNIIF